MMKIRFHFWGIVVLSMFITSCTTQSQGKAVSTSVPIPANPDARSLTPVWPALLQVTPLPHASPLPSSDNTAIDGTYAKFDPNPPQWWACLRCADYRPAGGNWRLQFDRGVMRIYDEVTGWHSLASYQVVGDHLYLFNDPYCKDATGEYVWEIVGGSLNVDVVNDPCSFGLRGKNLSEFSWSTCTADDNEPRGCTDPEPVTVSEPVLPNGLTVTVHQADVRLDDTKTPDEIVNGNGTDTSMPEGVRILYSDESMLYGVNRVLWQENDWMEMTFGEPFSSVGVQFRGSYVIGWARVLFDGQEIWRGDTSEIWAELKVHGGYIEVTGFGPEQHTLRVERLDVDSRPVMVAFFGLSK